MRWPHILLWLTLVFALAAEPLRAGEIPNSACLECHGEEDADPFVDPVRYASSAHGGEDCVSCHADITEAEHDTPLAPVQCGACHEEETDDYVQSTHGLALKQDRAVGAMCADCHGDAHAMIPSDQTNSPLAHLNIPLTCGRCHGDTAAMSKYQLNQEQPVLTYTQSVHGLMLHEGGQRAAAVCSDCHGAHNLNRPNLEVAKLYWQNIPDTCGRCHGEIRDAYWRSIHGQAAKAGNRDAPVCTDCHGEHSLAAVKSADAKVSPAHIADTCSQCHAAERIVSRYKLSATTVGTYMDSYHGLASRLGSVTAANCASCHGAHDILPSSDPRSSIHETNLVTTCGSCHAGITDQVAKGKIHTGLKPGTEHPSVMIVRKIYVSMFILVLGGMFLHNALDFIKKIRIHLREMKDMGLAKRWTVPERLQHGLLILTFVSLAYTGFALKFPDTWWATPFVHEFDWRGLGHRVAALVFTILSVYHMAYMLFTRRGRWELRELALGPDDLKQFWGTMQYYFGLRPAKPRYGRYAYMEKMEYWALVWGSIVMVLTGAFLTWNNWALRHFPKWMFDLMTAIHYYEAILACAAVIIWHFYFVIFDPDEYPVKWTFLSGRESEEDHKRLPPKAPMP